MIYKDKEKIKESLRSLLDDSSKTKAITKTRFFAELEKVKGNKIINYVFSDLEGKDAEELKEQLKKKIENTLSFIDKSEEDVVKNIIKKLKHSHIILTNENALIPYLAKITGRGGKIVNKINKDVKHEHIDLALVPVDKIDSNNNIITNKSSKSLIEKAKGFGIPIYCYTHSWNFAPKLKGNARIKSKLVKSIISELGIFEPEMFVQEIKLNYPWLF